jgi:ribonuclease R
MNRDTDTSLHDHILQFFTRYPNQAFSVHELLRRLDVARNDNSHVRQILNDLVRTRQLDRVKRKRYAKARPSEHQQTVGTFQVDRRGEGLVELHEPHAGSVRISSKFMGTALPGDVVSVAIFALPPSRKSKHTPSPDEQLPEGEILGVIQRSSEPIVGEFERSRHFLFVTPDNRRFRRDIYIPPGKTLGARPGDKVVAIVEEWSNPNLNPEGKVIEVLGKRGEVRAEMKSVIRMFNLPVAFPKEVLEEAEKITTAIPQKESAKRLDLRKELCFTIDPEDAKDFDDAISLEILPTDEYKLGVHIADVSHYVREGTPLDTEASKRGTSIYLADAVIPMLPEKLSNVVCSLRPHEDRLTYSAFMIIDQKGIVKDYTIEKSVINSKRRFTYEEVQNILETGHGDFADVLRQMNTLAKILLKKRMKEGSLDFETTETKFRFDAKGQPTEIIKKHRLDAHRLVEDFMLLANKTVATHIARGLQRKKSDGASKKDIGVPSQQLLPFIYRVHDFPNPEKIAELTSFVQQFGYSLNTSGGVTSRALQKLLNDVHGKEEEAVINEVAIRSMAKAVYSGDNIGHFGLGFRYYTHFTSPIRRYPDLVVHRLLDGYSKPVPMKRRQFLKDALPEICEQSSKMEQRAMEAERESVKVMQVEYMKRHVGDEFHAIISGVTHFGLFVEIADLLVEGLIRVRDLEDDYYVFDEKNYALIGRRTRKRYRLGDKVQVQVVRVDPEEREIDFVMVDDSRV